MPDNPLQKRREEEFINNDPQYNFGGFVPPFAFVPVPSPTPSPTRTSTPTPTPTITPTKTPTPTPTPSSTPIPIQAEYTTILNRASALGFAAPCLDEQSKQNELIFDLKTAGLWNKLGQLYMFRVDTTCASPSFTLINWRVPAANLCSLSVFSGGTNPVMNSNQGWLFDRLNRIQVGQNISGTINSITTTSTGNTQGVYYHSFISGSTSGNNNIWQTSNNEWNFARYNNTTTHSLFRNNPLTSTYDFTGLGYKSVSINGAPNSDLSVIFTNAGLQTTRTKTLADTSIAANNLFINGNQTSGSHSWVCGMFFSAGGGFTSTDANSFGTIITSYMTS